MSGSSLVPTAVQTLNAQGNEMILAVLGTQFWLIATIAVLVYLWAHTRGQLSILKTETAPLSRKSF